MLLAEPVVLVHPLARLGRLGAGGLQTARVLAAALARFQGVHVLLVLTRGPHADVDELGLVLKRAAHEPKYVDPRVSFKD